MSEHQPPSGTPEYLEPGSGAPIPPPPEASTGEPAGRRSRRGWWIGGGVVLLLGAGAGAWAAMGFFQQGAQPAEALPASTIGYVSIDLDPAGGQKIDAFRTLNKFPAFKHDVGIDSVDELRSKLGHQLVAEADCPGLDYDQDIDPWLGDRMAVAAVPLDGKPTPVAVLQVKDEGQARDGIKTLEKCSPSDEKLGYVVKDGWMVFAQTQDQADQVVVAADRATLADDATYEKWTDALGEAGVVNAYASPDAGRVLAKQLEGMFGGGMLSSELSSAEPSTTAQSSAYHSTLTASADDPYTAALSKFQGGAATLRFTGDGLEFALAADGTGSTLTDTTANTGGTLVQRLPTDTAAAAGFTFPKGWLDRELDQVSGVIGVSKDEMTREFSQQAGIDVPQDVETLLGSGIAVSVGHDFDFEAAENSGDGSGLPLAVTVQGNPAAIERVLDKIRAKVGDVPFLGSDSAGDLVAIGPSSTYRQTVLKGGGLGDDDAFHGVVPDVGDASSLLYVNVDALEPSISKAAAGDQEAVDNLEPLRAVGMSSWNDGGVVRFSFKVTTN
jgi:Protein of unknown function (DUF3352)